MATEGVARRERPGKAAILRAAVTVMGEDGYEGASMRDMAGRAGVSVAALYYHFPSKHDLLREFLDEAYDVMLARIERRLRTAPPTARGRLDEVVATLIASYVHDEFAQLASTVALREYTRLDPPSRAGIDEKRQRLLGLVAAIIERGVARGELGSDEPEEAARAIISLCAGVVEPFAQMDRPMADVIGLYQRFALAIAASSTASA